MWDEICVDREISKKLDSLLELTRRSIRLNTIGRTPTLMIDALPGFGKTAAVFDWAEQNDINLVTLDVVFYTRCQIIIDSNVNVDEDEFFLRIYGSLNKPNSVLFLDDYHRVSKQVLERFIFPILDTRAIVQKQELKVLTGLLFVVAARCPI